ncbi:MAG: hypothetical protein WBA17_07195 [Saprospiraceae bacterium]
MNGFTQWALGLLVVLTLAACDGREEKVTIRLTNEQRRRIDTLAAGQIKDLRLRMDSLCVADFEESVTLVTDSIVQERLEEEARLRARIPRPQ